MTADYSDEAARRRIGQTISDKAESLVYSAGPAEAKKWTIAAIEAELRASNQHGHASGAFQFGSEHRQNELDKVKSFDCAALKQSLPERGECDWPYCGCDEYASKVLEAVEELGNSKLTPTEAIYGFAAWLTTRDQETKLGRHNDCAPIPPLIERFCIENGLDPECTKDWPKGLVHPPEEVESPVIRAVEYER